MFRLFWKISRPLNLGLTIFTQILFYISASRINSGFSKINLSNIRIPEALTSTLACCLIAAGGYVINDLFDKETDAINKPHKQIAHALLQPKQLYPFYITLSTLGVVFGFITGPGMGILCIAIGTLLYFYSSDFKGEFLMGNLMVSLLAGMVVYIASRGVYEVSKAYFAEYASIAFFLTFSRELIKDLEDMEGDKAQGFRTLALTVNPTITKIISMSLMAISFAILGLIYFHSREISFLISSLIITVPLGILIAIRTKNAQTPRAYHQISIHLKQLMFWGMLTCLFC